MRTNAMRRQAKTSFSHLFQNGEQAGKYSSFRPTYPSALYSFINSTLTQKPPALVLDLACGTGQATVALASSEIAAPLVVGVDVSREQLNEATPHENVVYKQGLADDLLPILSELKFTAKPDLITVAQGFHWLEYDTVLQHIYEVLDPAGTVVVWGYGNPELDIQEANNLVNQGFYNETLSECWSPRRHEIENKYCNVQKVMLDSKQWTVQRYDSRYKTVELNSTTEYKATVVPELGIDRTLTVEQLIGYLQSWSGYRTWRNKNQDASIDPLEVLATELSALYPEDQIKVHAPVFMLIAKPDSGLL